MRYLAAAGAVVPRGCQLEELAERGVFISPDAEDDLNESARLVCHALADGVEPDSLRPIIVTAIGREVVADQVIESAGVICQG